ncbi:Asp-tRNA(Asn)/Glu-tRNA(Gln) amidotransferase A subunit family amidase [Bradyrhizobium sp. LB7.2]
MDIGCLDVTGAAKAILSRSLSPIDLTEHMLERISLVDPHLKAFVEVLSDQARASAKQADAEIRNGQYRGPLHGIPIAIKELYDIAGVRTRSGSRVREHYVAQVDGTVIRKLRDAGAVLLGTTTTYEFAFGFEAPQSVMRGIWITFPRVRLAVPRPLSQQGCAWRAWAATAAARSARRPQRMASPASSRPLVA